MADENKAFKVPVNGKTDEYFIVENRQKKNWDKYLPGSGVLVWHLDEDQNIWNANVVNSTGSHQRVDIVEANGRESSGDASAAFPGSYSVTSYMFRSWADKSVFGFTDVRVDGEKVEVQVNDGKYTIEPPVVTVSDVKGSSVTVNWTAPQMAKTYSLRLMKGEELVISKQYMSQTSLVITALEPETAYSVEVVAVNDGQVSEPGTFSFTTGRLAVDEQTAVALEATDVSKTGFTANWQTVYGADSYEVRLYTRTETGQTTSSLDFTGYGTDNPELPAGWESNTASTSAGAYGKAAPSLKFSSVGQYLQYKKAGRKISAISFWHKSNNANNAVIVLQLVNGEWKPVGNAIASAAGTESTELLSIDNADGVRLLYTDHKAGYLCVDDVEVTHTDYRTDYSKTVTTTDTSYVFTSLDAGKKYSYDVRGQKDGVYSAYSEIMDAEAEVADGIDEISARQPVDGYCYNLNGQRVGATAHGIVIVNGKKVLR